MRRLLIIPSVVTTSVASNDAYNEFYSLTENIASLGKKAYWYFVIPPWVRDGLKANDSIHYIHIDATRDAQVNEVVGYSTDTIAGWFARRGGRHVVDAVVTDCIQFATQLGQILADPYGDRVPIILRDMQMSHSRRWKNREDAISVATNIVTSRFAFWSDQHRTEVVDFLREYMQPSLISYCLNNSITWPVNSDVDFLEKHIGVDKHDEFVVFCGGDPERNGTKRILSICKKLFAFDVNTRIVSQYSASKVKRFFPDRDTSYLMDMSYSVTPDSYYLEAAKAHAFVSVASTDVVLREELERLLLGQIGVFPDNVVTVNVLGPKYPFYYPAGDDEKACEVMLWVAENYDKAIKRIEKHVKAVREKISSEGTHAIVWSKIEEMIDAQYQVKKMTLTTKKGTSSLFGAVQKVATTLGDEFTMQVFIDILEEHLPWLKPWGNKGSIRTLGRAKNPLPTVQELRMMLDNLGWVDICRGPEIVLRKEGDAKPGVF